MIKDFVNSSALRINSPWYSKYLRGVADLWFLSDLNGKSDLTTEFVSKKGPQKRKLQRKKTESCAELTRLNGFLIIIRASKVHK